MSQWDINRSLSNGQTLHGMTHSTSSAALVDNQSAVRYSWVDCAVLFRCRNAANVGATSVASATFSDKRPSGQKLIEKRNNWVKI